MIKRNVSLKIEVSLYAVKNWIICILIKINDKILNEIIEKKNITFRFKDKVKTILKICPSTYIYILTYN